MTDAQKITQLHRALKDCLAALKIALQGMVGAFPNVVWEEDIPRFERLLKESQPL